MTNGGPNSAESKLRTGGEVERGRWTWKMDWAGVWYDANVAVNVERRRRSLCQWQAHVTERLLGWCNVNTDLLLKAPSTLDLCNNALQACSISIAEAAWCGCGGCWLATAGQSVLATVGHQRHERIGGMSDPAQRQIDQNGMRSWTSCERETASRAGN